MPTVEDEHFGNAAEVAAAGRQREDYLQRAVRVQEGHIVLGVGFEYNIALNRARTHTEILGWTWHLCEKTWVTPDLLRRFITVACEEARIERPNP